VVVIAAVLFWFARDAKKAKARIDLCTVLLSTPPPQWNIGAMAKVPLMSFSFHALLAHKAEHSLEIVKGYLEGTECVAPFMPLIVTGPYDSSVIIHVGVRPILAQDGPDCRQPRMEQSDLDQVEDTLSEPPPSAMTWLIRLGSWSNCFSGQRSWPTDLAWNITDLLPRSTPEAGKEVTSMPFPRNSISTGEKPLVLKPGTVHDPSAASLNNDRSARETRTDSCYYCRAIHPGHDISKRLGDPMHTYCVVLRPQHSLNSLYPNTRRCYLRANSAAQAMLIASEDPEWLVFGVEPARMSALPPQSERSVSSGNSIVA
jgi:hypothetical protein